MKIKLFHGSQKIIEKPVFGAGKTYNDYGQGFHCTEHLALAKEWAVSESGDGFANEYELQLDGLYELNLCDGNYSILHWLALLFHNRTLQITTSLQRDGKKWLEDHFLMDISRVDIVRGYRADDSYFSFARAFLANEISLAQVAEAMKLGKLGQQVVIMSPEAFESLVFKGAHFASRQNFLQKKQRRDAKAREKYNSICSQADLNGLYIRDVIREKIGADDARIR